MIRLDPSQPHEFHSRKAVKRAELAFQAGKRPSEQRRREDIMFKRNFHRSPEFSLWSFPQVAIGYRAYYMLGRKST